MPVPDRDTLGVGGTTTRRDALEQLWLVVREHSRIPVEIDDTDERHFTACDVQLRTPNADLRLVSIQVITADGFRGSVLVEFGRLERAGGLEWASSRSLPS